MLAASFFDDGKFYQELINALSIEKQDITKHETANAKLMSGTRSGFGITSWGKTHLESEPSQDTIFTGQGKYARHPGDIERGSLENRNNHERPGHKIFNCGREGCSVSTCRIPKDQDHIDKVLIEWRKERGYREIGRKINIAELASEDYATIAEVLMAERILDEKQAEREGKENTEEGVTDEKKMKTLHADLMQRS